MPPVPGVGERLPEFTLPDQYGTSTSLSGLLRGRGVLLVFFPFAFSGVCTGELEEIRDHLAKFQNEHVQTVAISCDPMFSLRAWDDREAFFFPLLSDFWPHGEVARRYGVFDEQRGFAHRGTFFADPDGIVQWATVGEPGSARDFSGYHHTLARLIGK